MLSFSETVRGLILTHLHLSPEHPTLIKMEPNQNPHHPDSVLVVQVLSFPVDISERILVESGNVLVSSPFLSIISWLSCLGNELREVAISLLRKRSIQRYISGVITVRPYQLFR